MIHVYGTSHVSNESLDLIEEKIDEHDPEIVALELDFARLNALLSDQDHSSNGGPAFIRMIKAFQDFAGGKTGVMPGEEMLHAYNKSMEESREVALIDQEIQATVGKLKSIKLREKVKAFAQLVVGFIGSGGFDFNDIPEEELIDQLLFEMKFKFPDMYRVLVEERNEHMRRALLKLQENNPDSDIVAFVGAAHRKELEKQLNGKEVKTSQQTLEL
ncbi:MAG: TraB/GumN family protein [Nanohaloarchaea archaeon]|nr:TraB/GumN family protein [Candidatus Nanohaloarchaea archaeon]